MKKFKSSEMKMDTGCDKEFEGETPMDVMQACAEHYMSSTDDAHKEGKEMMNQEQTDETEQEKKKWFEWFNKEWENR